ncbi:hypothetical protein [Dyadobacter tibetensis]|uniref:hypothetical protein n=1 Tax=Dyadobacter tibetensis TaxID=1211851 RepID=UPI00046F3304|nr:hypothetical protein [Dyadobacter tibetensis]
MKTIVIPCDFSRHSVQIAETVLRNSEEPIKIIFTHLFRFEHDTHELLFSNFRSKEYEYVSEQFKRECQMLQDLFAEKFISYRVEFFYGNRLAPFKNFLDYLEADHIAYSSKYGVPAISKSSLEAIAIIQKAGLPLIDVSVHRSAVAKVS